MYPGQYVKRGHSVVANIWNFRGHVGP
jgi:hypothetical protein